MRIRLAATGISHWHAVHDPSYLRQLARMPQVELAGVQDADESVARRRAAEVGSPRVFADYRRMLDEVKPDFVLALARHDAMARLAHELLDRGLPFLMEKPMGLNAEEVRGVADKARAKGAYVAVPMPMRYYPFYEQAKRMRFGPLSHLYVRMNRFGAARYPAWDSAWMLDAKASGGGCLRNLGVHGFDMFHLLTGEDAEVVAAQISNPGIEEYASVLFRSASGVLGTLEVGTTYPRTTAEGRDKLLDGADGEWTVCGRDAMLTAKDGAMRIITREGEETLAGIPEGSPSYRLLEDALMRWQKGEAPPAGVEDCWRAVRLVDEAYRLAYQSCRSSGSTRARGT